MTSLDGHGSFTRATGGRAARPDLQGDVGAQGDRLQALIETAPAFICTLRGPEHVFETVNARYRQLLVRGTLWEGRPMRETLAQGMDPNLLTQLDAVYRDGASSAGSEVRRELARGAAGVTEEVFIDFVYQAARDAQGVVAGVDVFGFEVTDQVRARQRAERLARELRESEERLRRIIEATSAGTWELDLTAQTVVADASLRALHGFPPEGPFSLETVFETVHPEDRARVEAEIGESIDGLNGGSYHSEYRVRDATGAERWVESRGRAYFDSAVGAVRLVGTGADVSARRIAEQAREDLLTAISNQPLLGVALMRGPELRYERSNALHQHIVGGRTMLGRTRREALPELEGQEIEGLLAKVLETGEPFVGREYRVRLDRRGRGVESGYFDFVYQAVRGSAGEPPAILVLALDVTDSVRKQREALEAQTQRAHFEQQLIGIVSHDLRNPLSAILLGTGNLARGEDLTPRAAKVVLRIQTSAQRALRLVKDLLDFTQARLGAGIPLTLERMDLHSLVRQSLEEVLVNYPTREVRLSAEGEGGGFWDGDRLAQVVQNLVSNAMKYSTPDSTISVLTRGGEECVELEVHNLGKPIPPEAIPHLFEPMHRASSHVDRAGRSVGLGLYIVEHIVSAHGGTVGVTSTEDAGTTFTVRLRR